MDFKNAVAVCLISLFSATLVVLIAGALDNRAASRIEPQLAQIVEELRAIRKAGPIAPASGSSAESDVPDDCLMVYYFHGKVRCPTCNSIEQQSHDVLLADYDPQLKNGQLAWKILNYEDSSNAALAKQFEISMPVLVLAQRKAGQVADWRRLDRVWALVGDKPAFAQYIREEVGKMLDATKPPVPETSEVPIPTPESANTDIPVPESSK
jgi:hypothetical protein